MNLLPNKEELIPITNEKSTFYECGFNVAFEKLSFEKQLQALCDVVRQSIMPNTIPNPDNDIKEMNGNCHTASKLFKSYLEELHLGKNIRYVFARKRNFDPDDITTIHSVVLVDSEDNHIFQVDATPFCGYKYGYVTDITHRSVYEEYYLINEEMEKYLYELKKIIFTDSINKFDITKVRKYLKIFDECAQYPILNAYVANAMKVVAKYLDNSFDIENMKKNILILKPYSKSNQKKIVYQLKLLNKQVEIWKEELRDLQSSNVEIKRQLELAINITQEMKMFDKSYERYANINGNFVRLSFINPRFLYENELNTVMIKPSAYFISKADEIKNGYITKCGDPIGEYIIDLSQPTDQLHIKPMLFSHPCGEKYIRPMTGTSNVMLFNSDAKTINDLKRKFRNNLCNDLWYKEIKWIDGNNIYWHPFYTNLVHGADNYSESSLHYLIGFPEHQSMTRFMYPNPKLIKVK